MWEMTYPRLQILLVLLEIIELVVETLYGEIHGQVTSIDAQTRCRDLPVVK